MLILFFSSGRRHTRCALVTGVQTCALPIFDYYDLHWLKNGDAERSRDIWRANLLGGSRVHDLMERLREYPTLKDFAAERGWDFGEGYIAGLKGISRPADHLIGKPQIGRASCRERVCQHV